jgi:hypothetical protein
VRGLFAEMGVYHSGGSSVSCESVSVRFDGFITERGRGVRGELTRLLRRVGSDACAGGFDLPCCPSRGIYLHADRRSMAYPPCPDRHRLPRPGAGA